MIFYLACFSYKFSRYSSYHRGKLDSRLVRAVYSYSLFSLSFASSLFFIEPYPPIRWSFLPSLSFFVVLSNALSPLSRACGVDGTPKRTTVVAMLAIHNRHSRALCTSIYIYTHLYIYTYVYNLLLLLLFANLYANP